MDISRLLALLRRRVVPILVCVVAGVVGAGLVSATTPKSYRATARLFVNIPAARGVQEALQGVELSSQLLQSYAQIATSRSAAERTSDLLDAQFTPSQVQQRISARPQPNTLLLDVVAIDTDPRGAARLADAAASVLSQYIGELETAENAIEARIIDQAVVPTTAVTPRTGTDLSLGALLGIAVGIALALLLESLDRTISGSDVAADAFATAVVGTIPHHRAGRAIVVNNPSPKNVAAEAYRSLRTSIRFLRGAGDLRTLVVTSAGESEGKTTTAVNLALAVARSGERVVLVDADLRRGQLTSVFGTPSQPGLTEVLRGATPLEEALQETTDGLRLLPAGAETDSPSEVLGSMAMQRLLATLADGADVVILDTPPLLPVTDAAVLAGLVDGVIIVARWGRTEVEAATISKSTLDHVGADVIGVVLNDVKGPHRRSYYRVSEPRRS